MRLIGVDRQAHGFSHCGCDEPRDVKTVWYHSLVSNMATWSVIP